MALLCFLPLTPTGSMLLGQESGQATAKQCGAEMRRYPQQRGVKSCPLAPNQAEPALRLDLLLSC